MRNYELTLILKASLGQQELQDALSRLTSFLQDQGAIVMVQDMKGKRQLLSAQKEGILAVLRFSLDPAKLQLLEAHVKEQDPSMRFMLTAWAPKKAKEKTLAKARETARVQTTPEEEKVELGDIDKKLEEIFKEE